MLLRFLILCLAQAPLASAALAASAGVEVTAEPSLLRLGDDPRATLRVRAPATASRLRLSASVGAIASVREEGPGAWAAEYVPPDETVPQVAIVSALVEDHGSVAVGWAALPLYGEGDAVVKTRPRARIEVEIGAERFGPAVADEHGVALVPVVVPPGVATARHGRREIDLHVPPTRTVHLALARERAQADREEQITLFVFAVTARGEPLPLADLELRSRRGAVGPLAPRAPGLYEATWTMPAGAAGRESVTAAQRSRPQLAASATIELLPGVATSVELLPDRERIRAGETELTVRALARDASGNRSADPLRFETNLGSASGEPGFDGETKVRVQAPQSFAGLGELRLSARSTTTGAQLGQLAIPLVPGAPAVATLTPPQARIEADGASTLRLLLQLTDRYGNPVPNARPSGSVEVGTLAQPAESQPGSYEAVYVPPSLDEEGSAAVTFRAGEAAAQGRIELRPRLRRAAVSPKLGVLTNFSGFTAPVIAAEGALRSAALGPQLSAVVEGAYWFRSGREGALPSSVAGVGAESRTDYFSVGVSLRYATQLSSRTLIWAQAGPGFTEIWNRIRVDGQPSSSERALVPGAQAAAGVEKRMWRGVPFLELRGSWVRDPHLLTLRGSLRAVSLFVGYRFELL